MVLFAHTAFAGPPTHDWSRSFNGTWDEAPCCVAIDANGYVIMAGEFYSYGYPVGPGEIDLGGGFLMGVDEGRSAFVAKYEPGGGYVWADKIIEGYDSYLGVALDAADNIILVGQILRGSGNAQGFVEKRSPDGTLIWRKRLSGSSAWWPSRPDRSAGMTTFRVQ